MTNPYSSRPAVVNVDEAFFGIGTGAALPDRVLGAMKEVLSRGRAEARHAGSMWGGFDARCTDEYRIISEGDRETVERLTRRIFSSGLSHGFLQGEALHSRLWTSKEDQAVLRTMILDKLICLAEAVGAIRCPSPTHGQRTIEIVNPEGIFSEIERTLGVDLSAPEQDGGIYGLRLRGRVYSDRHFDAIYTAWRMREVIGSSKPSEVSVCEIGGGAGLCAYYAMKLGFRAFTIIDLPQAQLAQCLVLASSMDANRVCHGAVQGAGVSLVRAGSVEAGDLATFDLVLNVDSLPEMPQSIAEDYLRRIKGKLTLLSINQESGARIGDHAQGVVREMAARCGLRRLSRHPSWMRMGYVEETFKRD